MAEIDAERRRSRARDAWPDLGVVASPTPATPDDWAGLARMAHAREHAGEPLSDTDHEAIARHPDPPSIYQGVLNGLG